MNVRSLLLVALAAATLTACACGNTSPDQPVNIAAFKTSLVAYHDSGAYGRDVGAVIEEATAYVEEAAGAAKKPALVLDIDETALSNWPAIKASGFDETVFEYLRAAQSVGKGEAIVPTLKLFRAAQAKGVAVFFLTGRDESRRAATARNLREVGYEAWQDLIMRPKSSTTLSAADYKAPERAKIEAAGYTILATVGDQPSDLIGGHIGKTFLVPNPFYRIP